MPRYQDVPASDASCSSDDSSDSDAELIDRPPAGAEQPTTSTQVPPLVWVMLGVILALAAGAAVWYFGFRESTSFSSSASSPSSADLQSTSSASRTAGSTAAEEGSAMSAATSAESSGSGGPSKGQSSPSSSSDDASAPNSSATATSSSSSSSSSLAPLVGTSLLLDFTSSPSPSLEVYLTSNGLIISVGQILSKPVTHSFVKANVDWADGALRLKVDGQSEGGTEDVKSGELYTEKAVLYGTVTTRAKGSPVPGVCHGFFFYADDNHEVDIELLTSFYTKGIGEAVNPGVQFTNQPLEKGGKVTSTAEPYGFDPTADFHDYTIEWTADATIFSVDGKVLATLDSNVPTTAMPMMWNSWSSGGEYWSAGPPTEDSYLLISGIAANWTWADDGGGGDAEGDER